MRVDEDEEGLVLGSGVEWEKKILREGGSLLIKAKRNSVCNTSLLAYDFGDEFRT